MCTWCEVLPTRARTLFPVSQGTHHKLSKRVPVEKKPSVSIARHPRYGIILVGRGFKIQNSVLNPKLIFLRRFFLT